MQQTRRPNTDSVVLDHLDKRFRGVHAVRDLSLRLQTGSTVALLGPNGAGKTTTISMLLGLLRPDSGAVQVLGTSPAMAVRLGRVGAMLQDGGFMPGATVAEVLALVASQYAAPLDVRAVLGITELETVSRRRVDRLSGGQAQRLRAAVALIGNPELLVLDEPTAAMDVEARRTFWATMQGIADSGRTVIFSTHYLEEADANAGRIVLMAQGRIVADGTPQDIKESLGTAVVRFSTASFRSWDSLPGVTGVTRRGDRIELHSSDSDATVRALLRHCDDAHHIEVTAAGLEEAFIALTAAAQAA